FESLRAHHSPIEIRLVCRSNRFRALEIGQRLIGGSIFGCSYGGWSFWPCVNVELENVGSGVMANDVQIVFAAHNLCRVNFRDQDFFTFCVWAGKKISERVDNATAAAANDCIWILAVHRTIVRGKITSAI